MVVVPIRLSGSRSRLLSYPVGIGQNGGTPLDGNTVNYRWKTGMVGGGHQDKGRVGSGKPRLIGRDRCTNAVDDRGLGIVIVPHQERRVAMLADIRLGSSLRVWGAR